MLEHIPLNSMIFLLKLWDNHKHNNRFTLVVVQFVLLKILLMNCDFDVVVVVAVAIQIFEL